ncbi:MAG: hypothetical protein GKS06_09790 [Acidobacteria bacterium]|nr:hypothetical protein [Acidobacteriota bacterium]
MTSDSDNPAEPRRPYHEHPAFQLAGALVEPGLNRITREGTASTVEPKIMHVLVCLAEAECEAVTKVTLGKLVWDDAIVSDKVLPRAISVLRKAFGDSPQEQRVIRTISKVGYQLVERPREPGSVLAPAAPRPPTSSPREGRRISAGRTGVLIGAATIAVALVGYALLSVSPRPTLEAIALPLSPTGPSTLLTSEPGHELYPEPGPTPGTVLYSADTAGSWDLLLLDADGTSTRLTSRRGRELRPVLAPNGTEIAYFDLDGTSGRLVRADLELTADGWALGAERDVAEFAVAAGGGATDWAMPGISWSPDGHWIATSAIDPDARTFAIYKFETATGTRVRVTDPPAGQADLDVDYSPDGRWLVVTRFVSTSTAELQLVDVETGEIRPLTRDHRSILGHDWLPDSSGVVFSSNRGGRFGLWHVGLNVGEPEWVPADGWNLKQPRFDREGRLLYESWIYDTNIWTVPLNESTTLTARPLIQSTHWDHDATVSPDASRLAFISARSGAFELWLANPDGTEQVRASNLGAAYISTPRWSPDGTRIVFAAHIDGRTTTQVHEVDTGETRRIEALKSGTANPAFTLDGQRLVVGRRESDGWNLWTVDLDGGSPTQLTHEGGYLALPALDADGFYFTKLDVPGLWFLPKGSNNPQRVHTGPGLGDSATWGINPDGVLLIDRDPRTGNAMLIALSHGDRTPQLVREFDLNVSPASGTLNGSPLAFTRIDQTQADLSAMPLGETQ